jgi:nuclear pore complex protein Nup54
MNKNSANMISGERQILEQMAEILKKWHPDSPECVFQHYFYQNVGPERAPFFQPSEGEDPRKWEEALKKKPSDGCIPVLGRGFGQPGIGGRMQIQEAAVQALYQRVNEINDSLRQRIEDHDLKFTVRTQEARRKHIALSRRTLALATKVQVLRNRGYALDGAEEELKTKLTKLHQTATDPVLGGRQEELWARMTVVRERAQMLKEETEKLGKLAGGNQEMELLDEETMQRVKKVCPLHLRYHERTNC